MLDTYLVYVLGIDLAAALGPDLEGRSSRRRGPPVSARSAALGTNRSRAGGTVPVRPSRCSPQLERAAIEARSSVAVASIGTVSQVAEDARPERVHTERLVLRKVEPADVDAMTALHADPAAVRHRPEGPGSPDQSRLLFASWLDHWAEFGFGYWTIELTRTGETIGFGGLQLAHAGDGMYLNVFYRLFPSEWGRGYAPEMVAAAVGWARQELPGLPITIITPTENVAARRVAEKMGFAEVRQAYFQGALSCFFELPEHAGDA